MQPEKYLKAKFYIPSKRRVTLFDEAKPWTHLRSCSHFLSIGSKVAKVVTFGKKLLPCACKFELCYDAAKSCYYFV